MRLIGDFNVAFSLSTLGIFISTNRLLNIFSFFFLASEFYTHYFYLTCSSSRSAYHYLSTYQFHFLYSAEFTREM